MSEPRQNMSALKLDHRVIHVSDWKRSNAFSWEVLGADVVPVRPGGSELRIEWPGTIQEAVGHLEALHMPVELGPVERAGVRGVEILGYSRDPDGSLLEFLSYRVA